MGGSFSPTARAAQLMAARGSAARPATDSTPPMVLGQPGPAQALWCEWPRPAPTKRPFTSIRQALLAIQARHA